VLAGYTAASPMSCGIQKAETGGVGPTHARVPPRSGSTALLLPKREKEDERLTSDVLSHSGL